MNEWRELETFQDVAEALNNGDEIQLSGDGRRWASWGEKHWQSLWQFRSRPRQPKMKQVKMFAFYYEGELFWQEEGAAYVAKAWIRVPAEDKTIEIPE